AIASIKDDQEAVSILDRLRATARNNEFQEPLGPVLSLTRRNAQMLLARRVVPKPDLGPITGRTPGGSGADIGVNGETGSTTGTGDAAKGDQGTGRQPGARSITALGKNIDEALR